MRYVTRRLLAAVVVLAAALTPAPAAADVHVWQGPVGGSWNEATNWAPTGIPNGADDTAIFQAGATTIVAAIPANTTITLRQLVISSPQGAKIGIFSISGTLVLSPADGEPAIDVFGSGTHEMQVAVTLARDSIVRVRTPARLEFRVSIAEQGGPRAFLKRDAGTVAFMVDNTYTGMTSVEGLLIAAAPNTIGDSSSVEVKSGSLLRLEANEVMGDLSITDAQVSMTPNHTLSVSGLHMVGGFVGTTGGGMLRLILRGDVTATSISGQDEAAISSTVLLDLGNGTRTFTVANGPATNDLFMEATIVGAGGVIKDGPGQALFVSNVPHTYPGTTWIKEGTFYLSGTIAGDVRVGDGGGSPAQFIPTFDERIDDRRSVTVEADGLFSMAETAETIDRLIINGGVARPGDHVGELKVRSLVMNGGVIETGGTGTQGSLVRLRNVTDVRLEATSTSTQTPIIRGTGRLVLDGSPDVIVNKGPQPIDLKIDVGIVATTGQGLTKSGAGVAQFTFNNQYPGPTNVAGGTLLIDGSQPASVMNLLGGTLGGTGLVGAIVGGGSGRIAPGRSAGTLSSGSVTLDPGVTFAAELNGTTAGTTHDRLHVTGIVALANTTLSLAVAAGATLPADTKLTIIDNDAADAVTGTFANLAEGATVGADGHSFVVSYRGGDGNDVVVTVKQNVAPTVPTYYLAEGATGGFFDEDVLIANPNDTDAPVTLTFLQEGGGTVVEHRTVPKQGRLTVRVDQITGLENASASVQVGSDQQVPLVVERTMFWDGGYYGGHTANAVAKPETKWMLAEGFQGFFDTYLLIANANPTDTTATVTFLRENDTPVVKTIPIAAFARKTVYAGEFSELIGRAFGIVVEATQPVIAERSMYFASIPGRLWTGGHVNTGVTAPSTSWFHAEGATGGFFNTFILLSNPQTTDAHVDLRFLLEDGTTIVRTKTLPAGQRLTVNPAAEGEPRLENAAVSTIVASDVPIVSERSMYWPGDATPFGEGHNSSGVVATATRWGLAEGRVGAPRNFTTYILLANPTTTAADVTVTYLRESGAPVTKTYTVPPTSRFNIDVASAVPELRDESFGARIEVTNSVAIAVERSLYWDANGTFWAGGTNALGTPLP